jgi:hypothetical protein
MERFDVSPIKINHLAFELSKSGGQFDLRFEDSEAALDVCQTLVALHDRLRA